MWAAGLIFSEDIRTSMQVIVSEKPVKLPIKIHVLLFFSKSAACKYNYLPDIDGEGYSGHFYTFYVFVA